jgi:hypothetical protein
LILDPVVVVENLLSAVWNTPLKLAILTVGEAGRAHPWPILDCDLIESNLGLLPCPSLLGAMVYVWVYAKIE